METNTRNKILQFYLKNPDTSTREIASACGIKAYSNVQFHLERLRRDGSLPERKNRKKCPMCHGNGKIVDHPQFLKEKRRNRKL